MSGVGKTLSMPPPYTVVTIKQQIELKHGTPTFLPRIISGTAELADDLVPGDVVMLLNQEPPRPSTEDLLRKTRGSSKICCSSSMNARLSTSARTSGPHSLCKAIFCWAVLTFGMSRRYGSKQRGPW